MTFPSLKAETLQPNRPFAFLLLAGACMLWRSHAVIGNGISLYVDEAQYWAWSMALDWGYFSKPPGIAVLIAASRQLFGDDVLGIKLLCMLCYPIIAWVGAGLAETLYNPRTGQWTAVSLLSLPIFAWLGLFASSDAPLVLCWTLALSTYVRALRSDRLTDWCWLGLWLGLGLLSKYTMLVWLISGGLHLLLTEPRRLRSRGPWLALILAGLLCWPNLRWNISHDFPTFRHTAEITWQRQSGGWLSGLGFIASQWAAGGLLLMPALIGSLRTRHLQRPPTVLLACFSLPLWGIACLQALSGSANANWAAPAFVPATILALEWLLERQALLWLWSQLLLNLLLAGLLYHWPATLPKLFPATPSPYERAQGWRELAGQLRQQLPNRSNIVLIAEDRSLLAHFQYELRDLGLQVFSWNPEGKRHDHYQLSTHLAGHIGIQAIYLSNDELRADIAGAFRSTRRLGEISTHNLSKNRNFLIYELNDFQGY